MLNYFRYKNFPSTRAKKSAMWPCLNGYDDPAYRRSADEKDNNVGRRRYGDADSGVTHCVTETLRQTSFEPFMSWR